MTLKAGEFRRKGDDFVADYEATVFPWSFMNESGRITMHVPAPLLAQLQNGGTIAATGEGVNHRGRTRRVTAQAIPTDASSGRLKIRITAEGFSLTFSGSYHAAE